MYINKAMVFGNLTRDPELKTLPNGTSVCSFSVATTRTYKDRDGKRVETPDYHNIVLFMKLAELAAQYLKKGSSVYIEGRLQTQSWEKEGVKHYRTEIVADSMQFGPRTGGGEGNSSSAPQNTSANNSANSAPAQGNAPEYPTEDINPEDIPF